MVVVLIPQFSFGGFLKSVALAVVLFLCKLHSPPFSFRVKSSNVVDTERKAEITIIMKYAVVLESQLTCTFFAHRCCGVYYLTVICSHRRRKVDK